MKIWIAALAVVALVGVNAPVLARTALTVAHNDRVHYVVHLVAGQTLSLCPCTGDLAQTQIAKGMYHARTPRQVALLTERPSHLVSRAVRHVVA